MYSRTIKQNNFRIPDGRYFEPSSQGGSVSLLHLSYKLADLQKEIEKRTFYLGKYRKTEEAQHLLDLIGMSRDEGDLLYSFAKAAMADVYDSINRYTLYIPKRFEWKTNSASPTAIPVLPTISSLTLTTSGANPFAVSIGEDKKSINVGGTFTITLPAQSAFNSVDHGVEFKIQLTNLQTKRTVNTGGSGTDVFKTDNLTLTIKKEYCMCTNATNNTWVIAKHNIPISLSPATATSTEEILYTTGTLSYVANSVKAKLLVPIILHTGDLVTVNGTATPVYEMTKDTNSNDFNSQTDCVEINTDGEFTEGIHYYLEVPDYINDSAVAPLDTAILEALVNLIIFKWLVLSFPSEAATYQTLYEGAINSIRERCGVFRKNWQKTPRIF